MSDPSNQPEKAGEPDALRGVDDNAPAESNASGLDNDGGNAEEAKDETAPVLENLAEGEDLQNVGDITTETAKEEEAKVEDAVATEAEKNNEDEDASPQILKTKRDQDRDRSKNNKFDPSVMAVTDDHAKIRTQVHFYFSDSNLPTDKHLWLQTGGTENLPVPLKEICNFKRMRVFQPYEAVVAALRASDELEVIGEPGEEMVKRKVAYEPDTERTRQRNASTVYVKGFGDEEPSTQFDIEAFFTRFGPVNAIRLRRTEQNLFKGSIFAEFPSEAAAKKFLETDPAPTWKGHPLKIQSKSDYIAEKNELIRDGKIVANDQKPRFWQGNESGGRRGGRGNFRGGRGRDHRDHRDKRGDRDPDDWKKRREDDQKHGFRDRKDRFHNNRGGGGGGGRGRGRGGRDRDENRQRREGDTKPVIHSSAGNDADAEKTNGKRARDGDDGEVPPAKKVDAKPDETAAAAA